MANFPWLFWTFLSNPNPHVRQIPARPPSTFLPSAMPAKQWGRRKGERCQKLGRPSQFARYIHYSGPNSLKFNLCFVSRALRSLAILLFLGRGKKPLSPTWPAWFVYLANCFQSTTFLWNSLLHFPVFTTWSLNMDKQIAQNGDLYWSVGLVYLHSTSNLFSLFLTRVVKLSNQIIDKLR